MATATVPRGKAKVSPAAAAAASAILSPLSQVGAEMSIDLIDIDHNVRSSDQVGDLTELAASIAENGVLQRIRVVPSEAGRFWLVYGQRRLLAAKQAGLTTIPVDIGVPGEDIASVGIVQLVENLQRRDLNAMDEARALRRILDGEAGLTQEALAVRIGRSAPWVSNTLRLLELTKSVQKRVANGELSSAHAKVIVGFPIEEHEAIAKESLHQGYSAHDLERRAQQIAAGAARAAQDAIDRAAATEALVAFLEAKAVPKDQVLVVMVSYKPDPSRLAAIEAAGWEKIKTTNWIANRPKGCDCTTWAAGVEQGKPFARLTCTDDKHGNVAQVARDKKNEEARVRDRQLNQVLDDALADSVAGDAPLPDLFARVLLWHLLSWNRDEWAKGRDGAGEKKTPDVWGAVKALKTRELRAELAKRLGSSLWNGYGAHPLRKVIEAEFPDAASA